MSNMMLTEVSLTDSAILHSHTFGHRTALSTCIRPNNINHQEKRHHSRRGAPTKAQHKGSKEIQCRSKKYSSPGLQKPPPKGVSRLDFAVLVAKSLWRPNEQASSRKVKKICPCWSSVPWCFTFEARLLSWWSVDGGGGAAASASSQVYQWWYYFC